MSGRVSGRRALRAEETRRVKDAHEGPDSLVPGTLVTLVKPALAGLGWQCDTGAGVQVFASADLLEHTAWVQPEQSGQIRVCEDCGAEVSAGERSVRRFCQPCSLRRRIAARSRQSRGEFENLTHGIPPHVAAFVRIKLDWIGPPLRCLT